MGNHSYFMLAMALSLNIFFYLYNPNPNTNYLEGMKAGVKGLKIGVLKQGFGTPVSDPVVDLIVR